MCGCGSDLPRNVARLTVLLGAVFGLHERLSQRLCARELQLPLDEAALLDRFTSLRTTQQLAMVKEALAQARASLAAAMV